MPNHFAFVHGWSFESALVVIGKFEAIESEFVPVAVYNNIKGKDAAVLKRYAEPTWNNPVTRFVDAKGKDLIPRRDRVWSLAGTAARMILALKAAERAVPGYLEVLAVGSQPKFLSKASFAMY